MEQWLKISILLCVFGFIREIRPSEPYIIEFLLGEWRNITQDQVNRDVYPIGTYSYLAQLVVVFLITDFLRIVYFGLGIISRANLKYLVFELIAKYKPLIIMMGLSGIFVWSMLLWTTSLLSLQILEVVNGTYMATEIAYYTYIYAKVDKKYYPKVTSHTRAAMLIGKLVASILAQVLLTLELMDYRDLNYISFATQICATVWAFTLPKVTTSVYFHRHDSMNDVIAAEANSSDKDLSKKDAHTNMSPFELLWTHFKSAYTNIKVVQWSIWYAVGLCGYYQVYSYIQVVWKEIEPEPSIAWNGAVDAILTFLGAIFALAAGYIHAGRLNPRGSLIALALLSVLEGGAVLLSCWTTNIYVSYVGYIIFGSLYAFTITMSSAEVARHLEEESFGLVFGFNTLMGLLFQTILTLVVVSETGLALDVIGQYTVYAFYFIVIGVIYFSTVVIEYFVNRKKAD